MRNGKLKSHIRDVMNTEHQTNGDKPTHEVSRRAALKMGGTLLAAAALPWNGRAGEEASAGTPAAVPMPQRLTPAQRNGVTGKTADLGNGYYLNPILAGDYSDPAVLKDGKDYYMSHSMCGGLTPGILIWHSRDLVNWEPVCRGAGHLTVDFK
jgi:xylan 1,4-beta-xylosidase